MGYDSKSETCWLRMFAAFGEMLWLRRGAAQLPGAAQWGLIWNEGSSLNAVLDLRVMWGTQMMETLHFYLEVCSSFYLQTDQMNDDVTYYFLNTYFSVFATKHIWSMCAQMYYNVCWLTTTYVEVCQIPIIQNLHTYRNIHFFLIFSFNQAGSNPL